MNARNSDYLNVSELVNICQIPSNFFLLLAVVYISSIDAEK